MKKVTYSMNINTILDEIYPLPDESKENLKEAITEVSYKKGDILLRANTIGRSIYFIKKGMVRAYADKEDGEMTFWFGKEADAILSMNSYVANLRSYENIELLENCELYELKTEDLKRFFDEDIHITNFGRRFAEKELFKTEDRFISRQVKTATERYKILMKNNPDIIQRVPLRHIASFLGITQVSLSRIRAELK